MNIVINADDFGKTESRNHAMHECMVQGYADRASLVVNMAFDEAVLLAKKGGYVGRVGLHLNLAEGSPILSDSVNSILCSDDINGHFNMKCPLGDARLLAHHFLDMKSIIAIRKEIIAQMELFRSAGFMSDYIDSHCWSHMEFPVLIALLPIMKKYGFATIRSSWGLIDHYALGSKLNLYWKFVSKFYKGRVSETWSGLGQDYIDEYEKLELKDKRCEIYCHPDILEDKLIDTKFDRSYRHVYMTEYKQSILAGLGEV